MKLQFKHQEFQAEAVRATCDIFAGQPLSNPFRYILDPGKEAQRSFEQNAFANSPLIILKDEIAL